MRRKALAFLVPALGLAASVLDGAPFKMDGMYVNAFGAPTAPALIFVHGGPGYNSWDFEYTTASRLAEQGYYVIVYDERGQGRSDVADLSLFNYTRYADDLREIITAFHLKKPALLAHSHGGPIAVRFDQRYPGVAGKIVLISAPLYFWGSMQSMLEGCAERYAEAGDREKLRELAGIYYELFADADLPAEQLPGWVSAAFSRAASCGVYLPSVPTAEAKALRADLHQHPLPEPLAGETTAVTGFIRNENYVHFNGLDYVGENRARFCGIYGAEDGLFSPLQRALLQAALERPGEPARFKLLAGASHSVYIDEQPAFFKALRGVCGINPSVPPR